MGGDNAEGKFQSPLRKSGSRRLEREIKEVAEAIKRIPIVSALIGKSFGSEPPRRVGDLAIYNNANLKHFAKRMEDFGIMEADRLIPIIKRLKKLHKKPLYPEWRKFSICKAESSIDYYKALHLQNRLFPLTLGRYDDFARKVFYERLPRYRIRKIQDVLAGSCETNLTYCRIHHVISGKDISFLVLRRPNGHGVYMRLLRGKIVFSSEGRQLEEKQRRKRNA